MESLQELNTCPNEQASQYERPRNSIEQHLVVRSSGHLEGRKNEDKNQNIVYAQRFFHHVSGQKLKASFLSERKVNPDVENERKPHPSSAFHQCFLQLNL